MSDRAARLRELLARTAPPPAEIQAGAGWQLAALSGRLVEISAAAGSAGLTAAVGMVLAAQREGEPVAWVTPPEHGFFPPDLHDSGVDLEALVVVRVPDLRAAARTAEHLLRSGAFGLVILDLVELEGAGVRVKPLTEAMLGRLVSLAGKHDAAVICLTSKRADAPSLGSMVSLRVEALREAIAPEAAEAPGLRAAYGGATLGVSGYRFRVMALKDKRRGPSWEHAEVVRGPTGLR
jgi:recombination protein RecA